jgi:hypothetical protein
LALRFRAGAVWYLHMRRFLSCLLLLVVAFPLVAPALGQTAQKQLLLCCRKGGAHHCAEAAGTAAESMPSPALRAHCPAWGSQPASGDTATWIDAGACLPNAELAIAPLSLRPVAPGYRMAPDRSRQQRGPPAAIRL